MRHSLSQKLGPLPRWGWLAIGGSILLYVRQRNQASQDAQTAQDASGSTYGGGGYQGDPYAAPGAGPQAPAAAASSGTSTDAGRTVSATGNIVNVNLAALPTQGVTQPPLTAPRPVVTPLLPGPKTVVGGAPNEFAAFMATPEYQTALQLSGRGLPRSTVGTAPPAPGGLPSAQSKLAPRYVAIAR